MDNKERSLLVSELMRFEEMMDERIPIPDFTSTSSLIESFEKSLVNSYLFCCFCLMYINYFQTKGITVKCRSIM